MNERMAKMEQKVENIEKGVERIEKALAAHVSRETVKYDRLAERFSGKWVEKAFIGLIIAVIGSVLTFFKYGQ